MFRSFVLPATFLALLLPACSSDNGLVLADAALDANAAAASRKLLVAYAGQLHAAAVALTNAAPASSTAGWSPTTDPAAVAAMRTAWKQADSAYQGLQSATEIFFPDLGTSIGSRYESALALGLDPDLFDGQGFVGLHAVERILWADSMTPSVLAFEGNLPGYTAAAFPPDGFTAAEFKDALCQRLVADTATLKTKVAAFTVDSPTAYGLTIQLVMDQLTKLDEAGVGKDESRYAGFTLADMRANVAAAEATQAAFHGWLLTKTGGTQLDGAITAGFAKLDQAYLTAGGDALPAAPAGWSSIDPSDTMIISQFGQLFLAVRAQTDDTNDGSLLRSMNQAVLLLGILPSTSTDGGTDASTTGLPHDTDDM